MINLLNRRFSIADIKMLPHLKKKGFNGFDLMIMAANLKYLNAGRKYQENINF